MRRRTLLRTVAGVAAFGATGSAAAHPSPVGEGPVPSETPIGGAGPLGSLPLEGAKEAVVHEGTTVFLATTDGFAVVDATDPTDLAVTYRTDDVLGDRADGPLGNVRDVKVDGDRLLVAGPANGRGTVFAAAVVYDVSDLAAPERVTVHETQTPIHNADIADGVVYLTGNGLFGNPLVTVDAETGEELGRWSLFDRDDAWQAVSDPLRVLHDVSVRGDRAYLAHWDAGTWILDVSDPAAPSVVSRVRGRSPEDLAAVEDPGRESTELPGNDHYVAVDESGTLLGTGLEAWAEDEESVTGPGGLRLYDVSDPTSPEPRAVIDPPPTPDARRSGVWTTAHNFEFAGDRLYSSWYQGGVKVHDVSDPTDPRELYHWRDGDDTKFWTAQLGVPGEFFVASSWETPADETEPGGLCTFPDPVRTPSTDGGTGVSPVAANGDGLGWVAGLAGAGLGALGLGAWRARRQS